MTQSRKARPAPPGKLVIFSAAEAPTLDETGMMDAPVYPNARAGGASAGAAPSPGAGEFMERAAAAARLTVPFRQEGPGGFSLVVVEFGPGYLLPRHSHSSDCLYYVIGGELRMGNRVLGAGDGFFLPAEQPYAYRAGPQGVKLLEFRHQASFDIKILEKDMARFRGEFLSSLEAVGVEGAAGAQG